MTRTIISALSILSLILCSCSNHKSEATFYGTYDYSENDSLSEESLNDDSTGEDNVIAIPFVVSNGVKVVSVMINDMINVDMIVDTGCSGAMISLSEAKYLAEKGALTIDDVLGTNSSQIADGSIVENTVVHLSKLTIGGKLTATDVTATVSNNISAPLLLGNEVLNRVKAISIDNENQQILFQLY